jgi:transcriptional regulator with XRE-family HTH domain
MSKITYGMKDRITQFLTNEGISPAEFADKIGVQRSSVSHVLNGRNYPSASFIQKMLASYKNLNPRWLLLGEGSVSDAKSTLVKEPTLFQPSSEPETPKTPQEIRKTIEPPANSIPNQLTDNVNNNHSSASNSNQLAELNLDQSVSDLLNTSIDNKEVERIVLFYKDKTFTAYTPSK